MYDFSPSPEQQAVLDQTNAIMREHIYPAEAEYSEDHGLPEARMRELQAVVKRAGLWAPHLPTEAGGLGMGVVTLGLMNEILGRSPIAPRAFGTNAPDTGNHETLWMCGTPEQKETYLTPSVAGEIYSAFAMTEPEYSGSDPVEMGTTAVLDGDLVFIEGGERHELGAGDCLELGPPSDCVFKNESPRTCKYAVVLVRQA